MVKEVIGRGLVVRFRRVYDGFELTFHFGREEREAEMGKGGMTRRDLVLAALAPANGDRHTPVMVQKLLFIVDDKLPLDAYAPRFHFVPYDYGPFDVQVYEDLEALCEEGLVDILPGYWQSYRLTVKGQERGDSALGMLSEKQQEFVRRVSAFVRKLSFTQLVSAIYKAYPKMSKNSVFRG